jgi:hypothetical protein
MVELIRDAYPTLPIYQDVDGNGRYVRVSILLLHTSNKSRRLCHPSAMNSKISFGPSDQQWHYSPSTRTYDLSGGIEKRLTIATTDGPNETSITIAPETTALVIVDMQNFFLDPKCMDHPHGLNAVEPTIKVIEKCREEGIQVYSLLLGL